MTPAQVWENPCKACHNKPLGGIVSLKCKDGTEIPFLCHTMIDPASSCFEVVELPVTIDAGSPMDTVGQKGTKTHNNTKLQFDKSSAMISNLVNKTWFSHYPCCQYIINDNESEFIRHFEA
jgi:hypothetical protein